MCPEMVVGVAGVLAEGGVIKFLQWGGSQKGGDAAVTAEATNICTHQWFVTFLLMH